MAAKITKARAPFIPIPMGVRCVVHQTYMGRAYVNVVGVMRDTNSTAASVANSLRNAWEAVFKPLLSDKWFLNSVEARMLDKEDGEVAITSVGAINGIDESFALPRGVSLVVQLGTGGAGRARHGRIYVSGIAESSFENQDNTFKDTLTAPLKIALLAQLRVGEMIPPAGLAVLSTSRAPDGTRRVSSVYDEPTNTWIGPQGPGSVHPVTSVSTRPLAASQRRRNG